MKSIVPHIFFSFILTFWAAQSHAQTVQSVKIDDVVSRIEQGNDTTYIVNFWATWCAPCVKELPLFEEINEQYSSDKIKVLLISLDLKRDFDTRLKSFLDRKNLKSEVLFLDEKDPNDWIPKVTDQWDGVIPATWIVQPHNALKVFYAQSFEDEELKSLLRNMKIIP